VRLSVRHPPCYRTSLWITRARATASGCHWGRDN